MKITASRTNLLLFAILVLAPILRFQNINQPFVDPYSWREVSTAIMADNFLRRNWNIFYPEISWNGYYLGKLHQIFNGWIWTNPVILLVCLRLILPPPYRRLRSQSSHPEDAFGKAPWFFHWWIVGVSLYKVKPNPRNS